jgi:hypothetical protein
VIATLAIVGIAIPLQIHSDESKALQLKSPLDVLTDTSNVQEIKSAVVFLAEKYGLNENQLLTTLQCESGLRHNKIYGDSGSAYGVAQFHKPTFNAYCQGDYYNIKDQLNCLVFMWQKGLQHHWSCWKQYFLN